MSRKKQFPIPENAEELKDVNPLDVKLMLSEGVDYDLVSSNISKLEELGKTHPMSANTISALGMTQYQTTQPLQPLSPLPPLEPLAAPLVGIAPGQFYAVEPPMHMPVDALQTGKVAMGPYLAPPPEVNPEILREIENETKRLQSFVNEGTIPIFQDFLNFLLHKEPLSFGWVVKGEFLSNFYINSDDFNKGEQFIFWAVPTEVKVHTINRTGFQRSEGNVVQRMTHIFIIQILEPSESNPDPIADMINNPTYINLLEQLNTRGIDFIYDTNPNQLWVSIQLKYK